jgi:hypothetical protein
MSFNTIPENGWPQLKKLQELAEKVGAMPTFTSTDKAALEEFIANEQAIIEAAGLAEDVGELQTTVGDASSGLVKDVDDLQTTVGDSSAGLVKTVGDIGTYSTTETKIGKWGNQDLYRIVIDCGKGPNSTSKNIASGLSGITVRRLYGYMSDTNIVLPLPFVSVSTTSVQLLYSINQAQITINAASDRGNYDTFVVLEYTKNPPTP